MLEFNPKKISFLLGSGFAEKFDDPNFFCNKYNFGNSIEVNNTIKSKDFFKILRKNKINFPQINFKNHKKNWIVKGQNSYGSLSVKKIKTPNYILKKNEYSQRFIRGKVISVQFISENKKIKIISICEQINLKDEYTIDYLVTKDITNTYKNMISKLIEKLTSIFDLNGLNSVELISEKKKYFLIEINSRPGLGINIVGKLNGGPFFSKKKKVLKKKILITKIIYANKNLTINQRMIKFFKKFCDSKKFSELPNLGDIIKVNQPLCLVHISAENIELLKKEMSSTTHLIERIESMQNEK